MPERLTDIEFATMVLTSMSEAERIGVCRAVLTTLADPFVAPALLDAGHLIARHADALERTSSRAMGCMSGHCRPESAPSAPRPTAPGGMGVPSGAFSAQGRTR